MKVNLLLVVIALSVFSGCAGNGVWKPDWRADEITVYWVRMSPENLRAHCGETTLGVVRGCSKQKSPQSCTVFAPEPIDDLDNVAFATLGEEVAHCFYGDFHE